MSLSSFSLGERLFVKDASSNAKTTNNQEDDTHVASNPRCTVRFMGKVGETKGEWLGVEWDDGGRGRHDGTHEGKRYFSVREEGGERAGSFVRPAKMGKGVALAKAIRDRYGEVSGSTGGVDSAILRSLQKEINAPFLEVVGFDKVNKQQADFKRLRVISLRDHKVAGLLDEEDISEFIPSVQELNLAENLLPSWAEVARIASQLKRLRALNLSSNRLAMCDRAVLAEGLAAVRQLVLGDMGYDWREALAVATALPDLESLFVSSNRITEISALPEGAFENLKELDLSRNALQGWECVLAFAGLPNLESLNLNRCQLKSIHFPPDEEDDKEKQQPLFPKLKILQLSYNELSDWESIARLNRLAIQDFRIRSNPVLETEDGETCRQLCIASVATLKVVNGTEVFKTERYGAELDYWKKYGLDYLAALKDESLGKFLVRHPRYEKFLRSFGVPEADELIETKTSLKSRLVEVEIVCPGAPDFEPVKKKLPPNLTVHKMRPLLQRVVKQRGHELVLTYKSRMAPDVEVPFDNDQRELSFYGLETGDTILVHW